MKEQTDIKCLCELMEDPVGIDTKMPRFSWGTFGICEKQKGYRIVVSDSAELIAPVWDSGYVESEESNLIAYDGESLNSGTRY